MIINFQGGLNMKPIIKRTLIGLGGVIILFLIVNFCMKINSKKSLLTEMKISLEKVLDINEIHSYEYTYESFVVVKNSKFDIETYKKYKDYLNPLTKMLEQINNNISKEDYYSDYKEKIISIYTNYKAMLVGNNFFKVFQQLQTQEPYLISFEKISDDCRKELLIFKNLQTSVPSSEEQKVLDADFPNLKRYVFDYYLQTINEIFTICDNFEEFLELNNLLKMEETDAEKYNKDSYAVSYRGIVRAGIDEPFEVVKDSEEKIIVYVPEIKILSCNADIPTDRVGQNTIEYIKGSTQRIEWYKEAKKNCELDLYTKVSNDSNFFELAEQNLYTTIDLLVKPFISDSNIIVEYKRKEG